MEICSTFPPSAWKPKVPHLDTWEDCEGNLLWPGQEYEFFITSIQYDHLRSHVFKLYSFRCYVHRKAVTISILVDMFYINQPFFKTDTKQSPCFDHCRSKLCRLSAVKFGSPIWSGYKTNALRFEAVAVLSEYIWHMSQYFKPFWFPIDPENPWQYLTPKPSLSEIVKVRWAPSDLQNALNLVQNTATQCLC